MFNKAFERLKKISFVQLLAVLALIPIFYFGGMAILRLQIRPTEPLPPFRPSYVVQGTQIPINTGIVPVAESAGYSMAINTSTLNIAITHQESGRVWNTLPTNPAFPVAALSPLVIRFLGENSLMYEWDAHTFVIAEELFEIFHIENGVQVIYHFEENESTRLMEYIPTRIRAERFHEAFIQPLDEIEVEGSFDPVRLGQMRTALDLIYRYDHVEDVYFYAFGGLPPALMVFMLIELTYLVGYTRDHLIEDMLDLGLQISFTEPAEFTIVVNYTLSPEGHFMVDIPTDQHIVRNDFYTLQSIRIFPGFDASYAESNDGFIFVPDGAGKLIALDTFDGRHSAFNRPVYNNTIFDQDNLFFRSPMEEDLHMPVFGKWRYSAAGAASGFFAIVENGAETSHVITTLRTPVVGGAGPQYNAVFTAVDTMQFSRVRIFGPYSMEDARFLATTGPLNPHITVRYILYHENAGYYQFAMDYRQFLIDRYDLSVSYDNRPRIFVEFLGAFTVLRNFLGISYATEISMTSFNQAYEMLTDLRDEGIPVVANFRYGLNYGKANRVGDRARPVPVLGRRSELDNLLALSSPGNEVFLEASLMRFYQTPRRYWPRRFQLTDFFGEGGVRISSNWMPSETFRGRAAYSFHGFIHPRYLNHVVDGFMAEAGDFPNIALMDFGSQFYASYDRRDIIGPFEANQGIVIPILETMVQEKTLALDNPNIDRVRFAAYATNISRESSGAGVFYSTIPFRQLVMSGLTAFTTLNVNGAISNPEYFLLQAVELGAMPKFSVFYESTGILLRAAISDYFSHEFGRLRNDIIDLANAYAAAFAQIGTKEIANHEMLRANVFVTTYANGVRVYVNYNRFPVYLDEERRLEPLGFEIVGGDYR